MKQEFADVIDWLRSPEGEEWTRNRVNTGSYYGSVDYEGVDGFFNFKGDDIDIFSSSLWWGGLPGDDRLRPETEARS